MANLPERTEKQKEASRQNGSQSHGPVTAEGKARSSMNAYRHGLLSKNIPVGAEPVANFAGLIDEHLDRFGDLDGVEFGMVEDMSACYWRMNRLRSIEMVWMNQAIAADPTPDNMTKIANAFASTHPSNTTRRSRCKHAEAAPRPRHSVPLKTRRRSSRQSAHESSPTAPATLRAIYSARGKNPIVGGWRRKFRQQMTETVLRTPFGAQCTSRQTVNLDS